MTVVNGVELDDIRVDRNDIKEAILNNEKIEDKLHVIAVISNPCEFTTRYVLMEEFMIRMQSEPNVELYVVELAYGKQKYYMTNKGNRKHLQLRGNYVLWHKENMINLAVKELLPRSYKAFAWIDGDLEFESQTWAEDTLRSLNGSRDIIQLFSHCVDMNPTKGAMSVNSAGYGYAKGLPFSSKMPNLWHPGYAWAITRRAYEKLDGLYQYGIVGSGDNIMLCCILGRGLQAINEASTEDYKQSIFEFQEKAKKLRFGYVPGSFSTISMDTRKIVDMVTDTVF